MSQLELSMDRACMRKLLDLSQGTDLLFLQDAMSKKRLQQILTNILCVLDLVLHCTVLCYSLHVPIHTSTKTFSVVTLIGQEPRDPPPKNVTQRLCFIMPSVTLPCPRDATTLLHSFDFGC